MTERELRESTAALNDEGAGRPWIAVTRWYDVERGRRVEAELVSELLKWRAGRRSVAGDDRAVNPSKTSSLSTTMGAESLNICTNMQF